MSIQLTLDGGAVNTLNTEAKVERTLRRHEDARGYDKQLIVYLWLEQDGLAELLGDDDLVERFTRWFCNQATYTESITRIRRQLQAEGEYLPETKHRARRDGRRQQYRDRYRRN